MATAKFRLSSFDDTNSKYARKLYETRVIDKDASNTNYAYFYFTKSATSYIYYDFDFSSLPENIRINSLTLVSREYNNISSYGSGSYGISLGLDNFWGDTNPCNTNRNNDTLSLPAVSRQDLSKLKFLIKVTNNSSRKKPNNRLYGAELTVDYDIIPEMLYIKDAEGKFIQAKSVYKKENGAWVEQTTYSEAMPSSEKFK